MYTLRPINSEEFKYSFKISQDLNIHRIVADKIYYHEGSYGKQIIQGVLCPSVEVWYYNLVILEDTTLIFHQSQPLLSLSVALNNNYDFLMNNSPGKLFRGHFNMYFSKYPLGKLFVKKDHQYQTFEIHLSWEWLQRFSGHFPVIDTFISRAETGGAMLLKRPVPITGDMMAVMSRILDNSYFGIMKKMYLETKINEFLLLALYQASGPGPHATSVKLTQYEIERIESARLYIIKNMDAGFSMAWLSKHLHMNEKKLRVGFRFQYGTTPFKYLLKSRLDRALDLLINTNTPITEIAIYTGYNNISNFITAFSKRFGQSPAAYRRKK